MYLLMSVGALAKLDLQPSPVSVAIASIVGIAITGAAIWGSFYKVPGPTIWAPRYAVIWFVLGLVYMAIVKGREPASQALADLSSKQSRGRRRGRYHPGMTRRPAAAAGRAS